MVAENTKPTSQHVRLTPLGETYALRDRQAQAILAAAHTLRKRAQALNEVADSFVEIARQVRDAA